MVGVDDALSAARRWATHAENSLGRIGSTARNSECGLLLALQRGHTGASIRCDLLMIDLVVAFVLFIFTIRYEKLFYRALESRHESA